MKSASWLKPRGVFVVSGKTRDRFAGRRKKNNRGIAAYKKLSSLLFKLRLVGSIMGLQAAPQHSPLSSLVCSYVVASFRLISSYASTSVSNLTAQLAGEVEGSFTALMPVAFSQYFS